MGIKLVSLSGVISGITVTAANIDEREAFWDMATPCLRLVIGDKGYISHRIKEDLQVFENIQLETSKRRNMKDERSPSFIKSLMSTALY